MTHTEFCNLKIEEITHDLILNLIIDHGNIFIICPLPNRLDHKVYQVLCDLLELDLIRRCDRIYQVNQKTKMNPSYAYVTNDEQGIEAAIKYAY